MRSFVSACYWFALAAIIAKSAGVLPTWPWPIVLAPLFVPAGLCLAVFVVALLVPINPNRLEGA